MTVFSRFLRDRRRAAVWWMIGMAGLVVFTVAFYPSIRDQTSFDELMEDLPPAIQALFGAGDGIPFTSPAGYLHARVFSVLLPILLLIYGIGLGARAIGGSEEEGTLELLLSNPVTRLRIALERGLAVVASVAGLTLAFLVLQVALSPPVGLLEGVTVPGIAAATLGAFLLALLHASLAFGLGAATGRRGPAVAGASALAVGGYMLHGVIATTQAARPFRIVSPWNWYLTRNALVDGLAPEALWAPVALVALFAAGGIWTFLNRDLR